MNEVLPSSGLNDSIYVEGYAACAQAHLGAGDGTLVSRLSNASASPLSLTRAVPDDTIGVAVALDAHEARIRHGGSLVRSGLIPAGSMNFQSPGQVTRTATCGAWDVLFFYLPRPMIARVCAAADAPVDPDRVVFVNPAKISEPRVLDFARRVRGEIGGTDAFSRLRVELIAQDLVIHMLRHHSNVARALATRSSEVVRSGLAPLQLRRVLDAMDGLLEGDVTLAALADEANCSPTHFSRAFKRSTGVAPFAWLLGRRIDRAKDLLRAGDVSIAEVALAVGFSAQSPFTTAFKRVTGTTPGAWRRRHQ